MDTYEGLSEEELYRMEKLKKNTVYGFAGKQSNVMTTNGEPKQWQKDIMERDSIMSKEEIQTFLKPKNDPVNHPSHYTDGKIEVIDFIEDKKLGFHLGNAVKYISRAGKKNPAKTVEDLEKAIWYIKRYIEDYKQKDGLNIRSGDFNGDIKLKSNLVDEDELKKYLKHDNETEGE